MREHQIVVNLKAQQFEQLQKLARERGFKSVTAYVKQKILELALGLNGDENAESDTQASVVGVGDLRRIHSELKSFLEELSTPTEIPSVSLPGVRSNQAPASKQPDNPQPSHSFDWTPATVANVGPAAAAKVNFDLNQKAVAQSQSAPAATSVPAEPEAAPQVLPSGNLGGFGFGLGSLSSYGGNSARFQTPFSSSDRLSGYRDIMDDMEELADRAFAISPRLGALDENVEDEEDSGRGRRSSTESMEATREAAFEASLTSSLDDFLGPADDLNRSIDYTSENIDSADKQHAIEFENSLSTGGSISTSFVKPIVPEDLPGLVESAIEEAALEKLPAENFLAELSKIEVSTAEPANTDPASTDPANISITAATQPAQKRSAGSPMLPPPNDLEEGVRKPTFVPPPAPLPPRVSQTNIPAMDADIAAANLVSQTNNTTDSDFAAESDDEDLLSGLLDDNLTAAHNAHGLRDASEPNPFAVSLSFELEATAVATGEEQTPIGQLALEEEAELALAAAAPEAETGQKFDDAATAVVETTNDKAPDVRNTNDPADQSGNAATFSGTPPPKRRRT